MSPPFATAIITLDCPLYAADFDPRNNAFLIVGGGGGEGRSGVGNKIALLNTAKKYEISKLLELGLSRDEDSVTSLAFSKTTDLWASAFAGINSSNKEQEAGNNEHLRSFLVHYPPRKEAVEDDEKHSSDEKSAPQTQALGKTSYFKAAQGPRPETFQRILRLSKQHGDGTPRLGAVATGLAPEGEIVTFAADTNKPEAKDRRDTITLGENKEAADLDIIADEEPASTSESSETNFLMAYCTDYDVWITKCSHKVNRPKKLNPRCIHSIPHPDVFSASKGRPKLRSIRFLTPTLLLILQNISGGKGAELLLMDTSGCVLLKKYLHKKIKSGTALTTSALPYRLVGQKEPTRFQHAIAVAGADTSITIFTLNHALKAPYKSLKFKQHLFLEDVHPTSITSLTFSTHSTPKTQWSETPAQYLKLASTSIANTVVVETFPLRPYPIRKKHENDPWTYVLVNPDATSAKVRENAFSLIVASIVIGIISLALQSILEIRGLTPETLGAKDWLSKAQDLGVEIPFLRNYIGTIEHWPKHSHKADHPQEVFYGGMDPANDPAFSTDPAAESAPRLRELLKSRESSDHHVVIKLADVDTVAGEAADQSTTEPQRLEAALHHPDHIKSNHGDAKKWEDLEHKEKEGWKQRLLEAGEWTVEEGETVLKGIFFSGLAQGVGAAVRGI